MYIILVGAGAVGGHLAKTFSREGHDVAVIDSDASACNTLALNFDGLIINGDGTHIGTLKEAGIEHADCLAAVTGNDKDNMIACGLAKKHYHVGRTIGRVNDPIHETIFPEMGVDVPVSATKIIANAIENESALVNEISLLALRGGEANLRRFRLDENCPAKGRTLKDLCLPREAIVAILERESGVIIPRGDTMIEAGDCLYIIHKNEVEGALRMLLLGPSAKPPAKKAHQPQMNGGTIP
ncbi:MAG: TrkA family potassium uptake protein [Candidatus Ozemobacteraceae bacterium]